MTKRLLLAACVAVSLGLAGPAEAQSYPQADLKTTVEVIAADGAERTARVTVTNLGPDEFYVGDYEATPPNEDTNLYLQFILIGADLLSTSIGCEDDPYLENEGGIDRRCAPRKALAVGESMVADVRVRVTDARPYRSFIAGNVTGKFAYDSGERSASSDPDAANNGATAYLSETPACVPKAKSPQKLSSKRLVVGVSAPKEAGCKAELTKVVLRIGKTVKFRLLQPRSKTLAAGESWTQYLNLGNRVTRALQAARKRGKNVTARAAFTLDGKSKTKEIVLR